MAKILVALLFLSRVFLSLQFQTLWKNYEVEGDIGSRNGEFPDVGTGKLQFADDFEVPAGMIWDITIIQIFGFKRPSTGAQSPVLDKWTLEVYKDGPTPVGHPAFLGDIPTALIWSNDSLIPTVSGFSHTFSLESAPLALTEGIYWLTVYPTVDGSRTAGAENRGWYWRLANTTGVSPYRKSFAIYDSASYVAYWAYLNSTFKDNWIPSERGSGFDPTVAGLMFTLYGENMTEPVTTGTTGTTGTTESNTGDSIRSPSSEGGSNLGAILGGLGAVIGVVLIVAIVLGVLLLLRRRKERENPEQNPVSVEMGNTYDQLPMQSSQRNSAHQSPIATGGSSGDYEIDYTELEFENEIGKGAYGVVYKGRWRGGVVAIKQLMFKGSLTEKELNDFRGEAQVMKGLRPHVNVVQFLGITSSPQLCIITEYLDQGSLHSYIFSDSKIDTNILMNISKGITAGMLHLHHEGIVHRDLATRNILLGAGFQVKISDFGLSRVATGTQKSNQTKSDTGPLKWMSPEAIQNREYSRMSDVWAFGVTLWEIVSRSEPYPDLDPVQTALQVTNSGLRLVPPSYCPIVIEDIMLSCFRDVPEERPDFQGIWKRLQEARLEEWTLRM